MKFFSLQFLDKKTENKFQTKKQEITLQLMKSNSAFLTVFLTILIIISAYENNWIKFSFQVFSLITILICLRLNYRNKLQNYFQNSIIVFVIIFNYSKSIDHFLNNSQSNHLYIDGYIYALITISLINQATFIQKSIIIISIYLMLQIFMPNLQLQMWNQIIQFAICITFYIIYLYKYEQIQRRDFIQQLKHRKAFQQVVSFTGIQLYLVSYIREKNSLLLTMDNNEENITGQHQQQFIMQIRNMKVLVKDQDTQTQCKSQEYIRQEATFNLEKILFYFMTCPEKLKEKTKCFSNNDQLIKLQGILDADNYNIQIANLFDEIPSVILLITQNKKDVFIEELKLRYKLYQQALETIEQTFSQNIKMSLVYFTALQKINKQQSQTKNQIIYQTIQSKIGKAYNDFQNLKDFFNLNTSFQRTVIQNFDLLNFLDVIVNEIKNYYSQSKKLNFQILSKLRNSRVIQDQKQIKQLFLNLLYCITEHSQDIQIYLEDSSGFQTKSTFVKVRFEYRGMFFSKDALKGLPFINPITISELRHNTQQAYQLNLPMAVVLVRKLGPTNKIYIKQSKNTLNSLEFYIYKELVEDFHLMPLQSQHPLNYLITNTRSSVHGKHAAYFDLLSLSPRIQLDNFGEL